MQAESPEGSPPAWISWFAPQSGRLLPSLCPQKAVSAQGETTTMQIGGRHDPCIVPRAMPVLEAMVALVLADCLLVQEAYSRNGGA